MRSPLRVRTDELGALFTARQAEAPRTGLLARAVFTLQPSAIFAEQAGGVPATSSLPAEEAELHRRLTWVTSLYSAMLDEEPIDCSATDALASRWATSFHDLAQHLRDNPAARRHSRQITLMRLITDMRDDVAHAAMIAGVTDQQFGTWVSENAQPDIAELPYLGTVYEATYTRAAQCRRRLDQPRPHRSALSPALALTPTSLSSGSGGHARKRTSKVATSVADHPTDTDWSTHLRLRMRGNHQNSVTNTAGELLRGRFIRGALRNAQTEFCSTTNDTHAPSSTRTPDTSTPTVPTKASTNSSLTTIRQPSFHLTPQSSVTGASAE
jgi:hypothetical protein